MNKLGHIAIRAASLGDDLRQVSPAARSLGYRGVQLDLQVGELDLTGLSPTARREVRHVLSHDNLELVSLRMQFDAESLSAGADHDRVLWMVRRAIDATAGLGVGMLCIDLGRLPSVREPKPARSPIPAAKAGLIIIPGQEVAAPEEPSGDEPEDQAAWSTVDSVLREVGVLADRASTILALSSELSSFASLKRAIDHAGCPWFGVDLDPVSLLRDRWDAERVLGAVGPLVRHLRLRDALKGQSGRTQPMAVGQGTTQWPQLFTLLDEGGYNGWMTVDTVDLLDRVGDAKRALEMIRRIER
jgi:sugar phosphate isomerase/epimerase